MNTNTSTVKTNARRSEVWTCFLAFREQGFSPIVLDGSQGLSYVAIPAKEQPEWNEELHFLEKIRPGSGPFTEGWVGFLSYDWGLEQLGLKSRHESVLPKMWWRYCDQVFAFQVTEEDGLQGEFELGALQAGLSYPEYEQKITRIHELLRAGEIYQLNFTQDFTADFSGDPFALYAALFHANPSAMCFYAADGDWALCSNSPERLFSLRDGLLRAEPIKGTVGANEDPELLLKDEKTYAELTMIVDLLRNDLARVSETGSVRVAGHQLFMQLKNVWHTYSVIESRLSKDHSLADVLRALFPGGSVTGCPKERAMQWIDVLENRARGFYCGSAGYVSATGEADFNILIRSASVSRGQVSFGVGGAILMDSTPGAEWEELQRKLSILSGLAS